MAKVFEKAETFNQDISGWDVSNVTTMKKLFQYSGITNESYKPTTDLV
jgi:surface protein